jgi:hypothetical protein
MSGQGLAIREVCTVLFRFLDHGRHWKRCITIELTNERCKDGEKGKTFCDCLGYLHSDVVVTVINLILWAHNLATLSIVILWEHNLGNLTALFGTGYARM